MVCHSIQFWLISTYRNVRNILQYCIIRSVIAKTTFHISISDIEKKSKKYTQISIHFQEIDILETPLSVMKKRS